MVKIKKFVKHTHKNKNWVLTRAFCSVILPMLTNALKFAALPVRRRVDCLHSILKEKDGSSRPFLLA